jgi:hypothetical protein
LCFVVYVVYADELLHSQRSQHQGPFIAKLVDDLFGIKIHVPGLGKLKDLWDQASDWLEQAKTQSAEEALPPKNMWVLAMAYLVENYHQQPANATFLEAKLEMEKKCGRLQKDAEIDHVTVALGLPFYRDESLITTELFEHWRPVQSDNDGDGRRAQDAVGVCANSGVHTCKASCPLACHIKQHQLEDTDPCWHFVIYWQLVPMEQTDCPSTVAKEAFLEQRWDKFSEMVKQAIEHNKGAQQSPTFRKIAIQRMLSMHWNDIAKWIDEAVEGTTPQHKRDKWSKFRNHCGRGVKNCEPLRGAVKAFGTAGSAILRDFAIDA